MRQVLTLNKETTVHDIERAQQESYGKRLMRSERNVGAPKSKQKPAKSQRTGHEAFLAKAISGKKRVQILVTTVGEIEGEVTEFDKYSIKIKVDSGKEMWLFKSSIIAFSEV